MERRPIKLEARGISKSFMDKGKTTEVLDNISLQVLENEFLVILGPGRCGKTVLMNILGGIMTADKGEVLLDNVPFHEPTPKIGIVFQRIGLFPWKTVLENVELGPGTRGVPKRERRDKSRYFIDLVGLTGFENAYPRQLSGGMKQRVGIARAYANDSEILIMDEPFGALDAQTRYDMENKILEMWEKEKRSFIFVTNNIEEALTLGDRIVLLSLPPCKVKQSYTQDMIRPRDNMDLSFLNLREAIETNMDVAL